MPGSDVHPLGPLGPQVPGTTMLVYGSYPPVPGLPAEVTRSQVLAAWQAGERVTVVSPRPSAAHMAVRIAGPLSGHRLDDVRRKVGATKLVFCAEATVPFPLGGAPLLGRAVQMMTARSLVQAFAGFEHVKLVVTGDLGVPDAVLAPLRRAAHEVQEVAADRRAHDGQPVPALGPDEILWQDWVRRALRIAARKLLGSRSTAAGARLEVIEHNLRRALQRAVRRLR